MMEGECGGVVCGDGGAGGQKGDMGTLWDWRGMGTLQGGGETRGQMDMETAEDPKG